MAQHIILYRKTWVSTSDSKIDSEEFNSECDQFMNIHQFILFIFLKLCTGVIHAKNMTRYV